MTELSGPFSPSERELNDNDSLWHHTKDVFLSAMTMCLSHLTPLRRRARLLHDR